MLYTLSFKEIGLVVLEKILLKIFTIYGHDACEAWRDQTPIILPQQVQMHNIHGEPDDHRRRRERKALDNFKTESDLLDLRAQSHGEKYRSIDEEMISIISEKSVGRGKGILINMWNDEIKREEGVSLDKWKSKNLLWLKKYE